MLVIHDISGLLRHVGARLARIATCSSGHPRHPVEHVTMQVAWRL